MPSIKDLRKRITSVKNTQQTTRAMKMVSAAKLRRAQDAILCQRPFARGVNDLIQLAVRLPDSTLTSPLIRREDSESSETREEIPGGGRKVLVVLVTSDRGLCGAFNSNAIRTASRWIQANPRAKILDKIVTQSSDSEFHCLTITIFYEMQAP